MAKKHAAEWLFEEDEPSVVEISRAKGRAVVLLSNERRVKASATALAIAGVEVGSVLDVRTRRKLIEAEAVAAAAKKGVKMLARSAKTAKEIQERLVSRGIEEHIAEHAVEHLRSHALIDEAEIARNIFDKPATSEAMARHLMEQRGIDPTLIEQTLRAQAAPSERVAARLLDRKLPASLSEHARRQRLLSALARRGFDAEESAEAVREIVPNAEED